MFGKDVARLLGVTMYLCGHCVEVGECFFVT